MKIVKWINIYNVMVSSWKGKLKLFNVLDTFLTCVYYYKLIDWLTSLRLNIENELLRCENWIFMSYYVGYLG